MKIVLNSDLVIDGKLKKQGTLVTVDTQTGNNLVLNGLASLQQKPSKTSDIEDGTEL